MFKGISNCWPQGKKKALTLSYDDGNIADRRLVQIFNKKNLKATAVGLPAGLAGRGELAHFQTRGQGPLRRS